MSVAWPRIEAGTQGPDAPLPFDFPFSPST